MSVDASIRQQIEQDLAQHKVLLYMKGTPEQPMCGFSAKVVEILKGIGTEFGSKNVLDDEQLRQGIKEYSNWPTVPQLYVNGKFIGGCDIVAEMAESGELKGLLDQTPHGS